jgi:hypothetical protein
MRRNSSFTTDNLPHVQASVHGGSDTLALTFRRMSSPASATVSSLQSIFKSPPLSVLDVTLLPAVEQTEQLYQTRNTNASVAVRQVCALLKDIERSAPGYTEMLIGALFDRVNAVCTMSADALP